MGGRHAGQHSTAIVCRVQSCLSQRFTDLEPEVRGHFVVGETVEGEERMLEVKLRFKVMECFLASLR